MMNRQIVLVVACALVLFGCSKEEKILAQEDGHSQEVSGKSSVALMSSEDIVKQRLSRLGINPGMNESSGTIVFVGTAAEENVVNASMVTEAIRQRIFRKAFESGLAEIAAYICTEVLDGKRTRATQQLRGVMMLHFAEAYNAAEKTYDIAVAVVWFEKLSQVAADVCEGKPILAGKPGRQSLAAWVKSVENVEMLLGGKWFVDDMGDRWIVGMVTKDGSMSSYLSQWVKDSKEARLFVGEEFGISDKEDYLLKMYALNWASRMVSDDVSVLRELGDCNGSDDDFREEIKVNATFPLLQENDRVKWFERKFVNPLSQKEIEVLIAAVRCNDIAIGRKEYVDRRIAGTK